ncbi:hypothetical protein HY486_03850 [Candidatus Woesearchaeota archaeon]|nr:hypothetical protein [Candidatus Woesearchaeota archaeon]
MDTLLEYVKQRLKEGYSSDVLHAALAPHYPQKEVDAALAAAVKKPFPKLGVYVGVIVIVMLAVFSAFTFLKPEPVVDEFEDSLVLRGQDLGLVESVSKKTSSSVSVSKPVSKPVSLPKTNVAQQKLPTKSSSAAKYTPRQSAGSSVSSASSASSPLSTPSGSSAGYYASSGTSSATVPLSSPVPSPPGLPQDSYSADNEGDYDIIAPPVLPGLDDDLGDIPDLPDLP